MKTFLLVLWFITSGSILGEGMEENRPSKIMFGAFSTLACLAVASLYYATVFGYIHH